MSCGIARVRRKTTDISEIIKQALSNAVISVISTKIVKKLSASS
jgi:hypothetical protein